MKVILISSLYYPTIGGVTTYIKDLMTELTEKKIENILICPIYREDYNLLESNKKFSNVKFFIIEKKKRNSKNIFTGYLRKKSYNSKANEIFKYIKKNYKKNEVIFHQHDFSSNFKLIQNLKKEGYKIILTNHTGETLLLNKIPLFGKYVIKKKFKVYDQIVGPSKELAFLEMDNKKNKYFPNSIKLISEKLDLLEKNTKTIFFCPRRWAPTKGIEYYLKALKKLKKENYDIFKNIQFIFAGNEYSDYIEYKEKCEKLLEEIMDNNIILVGDIKDPKIMEELYKKAKFTVIPSLYEAVSLSALEAIKEGSVLISTDVGGMPELVKEDETGIICSAADEDSLYKALIRAYSLQENDYKNIQNKAYHLIYEHFNYEKLVDKYIELYKKILGD